MDDSASSGRTNILKKIIGFLNPSSHEDDVTEEEIISMVNEGHEQGVLRASEAEMIHNIFEFGDKEAKDIMTHRKNLIAIDGELSYNDAVPFIIENNKSRYPVYLEDIDNIIGVLHIKDAFAFAQKNEVFRTSIKDIKGLIREVDFVPETLNIHTLFQKMQAKKSHLVIVVDEYGQTAGIVTMEDILEEIVGDILDEYDEDEVTIRAQKDNRLIIDGLAYLEDVEFETLNGYLTNILGHIPTAKDVDTVITAVGYCFTILSIGNKTIGKVKVEKDRKDPASENTQVHNDKKEKQ